jgi:hypothetical protein
VLREPWAGGSAGDRRLRDLREAGVSIESKKFATADAPSSASWLWRLATASGASPSPGRRECGWERLDEKASLPAQSYDGCKG